MAHFPHFWGKKNFLENAALSCTSSYGFLAPCQNLEKVNDTIQRKCLDRWTEGQTEGWTEGQENRQKDGQTLFYRTLLATIGGPKTIKENKIQFYRKVYLQKKTVKKFER